MSRAFDELGTIVERNDLHSLRQARLYRLNPLLHALDYIERVDAVTRDNDTAHRFFAVLVEHAGAKRIAKLHVRDVAHIDGRAVC